MSWTLSLVDKNGNTCISKKKRENLGTMVCLDGTQEMEFNITYNYSSYFKDYLGEKGLDILDGMTGEQSIVVLRLVAVGLYRDYYDMLSDKWNVTVRHEKKAFRNGKQLSDEEKAKLISDMFDDPSILEGVEYKEVPVIVEEGKTDNYWKATAANVLQAIQVLAEMAQECPEGVWRVE